MADALVIGLAKKVKRGGKAASEEDTGAADDSDDEGMSLDEAEDDAVDEMVESLRGEDVDKDTFKSALRDFVTACIKRQGKGEY